MILRKVNVTVLFVFLLAASLSAQNIVSASPTISVSGKAELFVEPDFVSFRLDVTKENMKLEVAKKEADTAVANIRKVAAKFGLKNEDVSVTYMSVEQKFRFVRKQGTQILDEDGDEVGEKEFVGYEASTLITLTVKDLTKFQPLFEDLLSSGVDEIDNVKFQTTRLREVKDKAREFAMKAAREKAVAMAEAIGQGVGRALKVTEGSNRSSYSNIDSNISSNIYATLPEGTSFSGLLELQSTSKRIGSYSPGVIVVDAEVSVTFLLN